MKILVEKSTSIVRWGFDDSAAVEIKSDRVITPDLEILDLNSDNCDLIESVGPAPTRIFSNAYKWVDSEWKLLWEVQKAMAEISKKCSDLLLETPTGSEEEWKKYTESLEYIQDNLLNMIFPFDVVFPKKP